MKLVTEEPVPHVDHADELGRYTRKLRSGQITHIRRALQMYASFHLQQKRESKHPADKKYHDDAINATDALSRYLLKGGEEPT